MKLYDQNNRAIDYLRISITDRCNLSCIYCKPRLTMKVVPHREILRYEEMLRIVSVAVPMGITHIRVTGGEPLLRRGVLDFVRALKSIPGIEDISLTTNGVLLSKMARGIREAGVSRLNISLDSLNRQKFREITGNDCWNDVWKGINTADEIGFSPLKINMVPVKGVNEGEVLDFARLTLDRSLHVRFIEFMPIGAHDRWHEDTCVRAGHIRQLIERELGPLVPFTGKPTAGPSSNYQISGARGVIGFISPISKHFCASCRRLRLTADGRIRPCLLSDTEIDIKTPLRSGCDDKEVKRLLQFALQIKPERHFISQEAPTSFQRTMSGIGG